ncbi:DHBP synthase RibB-like alpha/beta domain-containing protein [Syncephalis plumigaleata]|nr:DHBP synthase RibB-like alpha/beta domain-containing protein [Syncephalis plumigaleata]
MSPIEHNGVIQERRHDSVVETRFDSIPEALKDFAAGKFLVVVDNEDRENEGDLIIAAEMLRPRICFHGTLHERCHLLSFTYGTSEQLELPLMVPKNSESFNTAFTVTVDYKIGEYSTGISAADRALTLRQLANARTTDPELFAKPGHIFPLRYTEGGVLVRPGHTELLLVYLCELSGLYPAGVLCEIVNDDGTMARRDDCFKFAKQWGLKMISIADLAEYRRKLSQKK